MNRYFGDTTLSEPIVQMFGNEPVVAQVRVGAISPVDLLRLAGAEGFPGIKAPAPLQQSLAAEHFVDAGDATGKSVCSVEDGGIGVGHFNTATQEVRGDRFGRRRDAPAFGM